jgi:hypothetical protein
LAFVCERRRWIELRRGLSYFALLAVLSIPALALLQGDLAYQAEGFAAKTPLLATLVHTAYSFFLGFSLGPSLGELHFMPLRDALAQSAPWVALVALPAAWLLWLGWRELRTTSRGMTVVMLALCSAPLIGAAGELAGVGSKVRYWSWILMPVLVWLAAGLSRGGRGARPAATQAALVVLLAVQGFALYNRYYDPRYANEDLRNVAAHLKRTASDDVPVFSVADYMAPTIRYYLNGPETLNGWLEIGPRATMYVAEQSRRRPGDGLGWLVHPRIAEEVRSATFAPDAIAEWLKEVRWLASADGRFWLIYSRPFHGDPGGLLLDDLLRRGMITLEASFAGAKLYQGRLAAE